MKQVYLFSCRGLSEKMDTLQSVQYKARPPAEFVAHLTSQLYTLTYSKTRICHFYISACVRIKQARCNVFNSELSR